MSLLVTLTLSTTLMLEPSLRVGRYRAPVAMSVIDAVTDASAISSPDQMVAGMDEQAIALDVAAKPVRGADGRLKPILTLPGDTLSTTPLMVGLTAASTALTFGVIGRALAVSAAPLWSVFAVLLGVLAGELFSGVFHWATDNCASTNTHLLSCALCTPAC